MVGEGSGTPLQYSCLENPMDGGAWWAAVHGVAKSRTRLSNCTFTFHGHALEKEMAAHFSVLAWRIPGTGEPGRLPSVGSHRVRHDWSDLAARYGYLFNFLFSIGVWLINNVVIVSNVQQSDSVIHIHVSHLLQILFPFRLLHNIEHGQRSLEGYSPWGRKSRIWLSN